MNFLAHIYLSQDNDFIKIGNFMADTIRGSKYDYLPIEVQKGILLHRAIDTFTDAHPIFRKSTKRLHEHYHHYSGVIIDVFYDHFLAKNWSRYSSIPLDQFASHFYEIMQANYEILTPKTQQILPYMISQNWLVSYATVEGIGIILSQMEKRIKNESKLSLSINELNLYYAEFENEFMAFFVELSNYSSQKLNSL